MIAAIDLGDGLAQIATALRIPVLIAAVLVLLLCAVELGRFGTEWWRRRVRARAFDLRELTQRAIADPEHARGYAYRAPGTIAAAALVEIATTPGSDRARTSEHALARYELSVQRRLDRTRLLVRTGPAIGLMGTLIPLAPGLAALGDGDVSALAENLRDAFGATVVGLLVGTVAFALTLARTRMYTEDLTALEQRGGAMSRVGLGRHGRIEENAGDPLDGLVNLFDIGMILAVAFLIAGIGLTLKATVKADRDRPTAGREQVLPSPAGGPSASGRGEAVGRVYRLPDGRLVYVTDPDRQP